MTKTDYHDGDGNPCTLDSLCRKEPAWAANRIRIMREALESIATGARESIDFGGDTGFECVAERIASGVLGRERP